MAELLRVAGVSVRRAEVADAAGVVALGRLVNPTQIATGETMAALLEAETPSTTERLVGVLAEEVVAWAPSGLYDSGSGWFWIGVDPRLRARGVGSALYERIEARVRAAGADCLETAPNDEAGARFLTRNGFEVANRTRLSELDPRAAADVSRPPAGELEVVALRDALDRADALFELYGQARADTPSRIARTAWSYAEWRAETLDHPLLDLDASVVILERGEPVSLAWLSSDREGHRAEALMTTTRRDRRGLGLARLAKVESARRAAQLGITRILTANDLENAPMLAINRRLGYEASIVVESFAKSLRVD